MPHKYIKFINKNMRDKEKNQTLRHKKRLIFLMYKKFLQIALQ